MKRLMMIAVLAGTAAALPSDCLRNGETVEIEVPRPPIDSPGLPADAQWAGSGGSGTPVIFDEDVWRDDPMGSATPSSDGTSATVPLTNDNGSIEGPNGEDVEPGDSCVEVYVRWYYDYVVETERVVRWQHDNEGNQTTPAVTHTHRIRLRGFIRQPVDQVCPC